jgi:hypothetical protein
MGEFLRTGVKGSLRGIADFFGFDWNWRTWGHLLETVRTRRTAFDSIFGEPLFDYLEKHPGESAVFNEGMTGFSSNIAGRTISRPSRRSSTSAAVTACC